MAKAKLGRKGAAKQSQAPKKGQTKVHSSRTPEQQNTVQDVEPDNGDEQSDAEDGPGADVNGSSGAEAKPAQLEDETKDVPKSSGKPEELNTGQDVGQENGDEQSEVQNVPGPEVANASGAEANGAGVAEGNLGAGPGEGDDNAEEKAGVSNENTANDTPASNTDNSTTAQVEGLAELIQVIEAWGSAPYDDSPRVKADVVAKLKETPLLPAYIALQSSWKNMLAHMSAIEAGRVPLPPSPPLTPQELSNDSTPRQRDQPLNHSSSPLPTYVDQEIQTARPLPVISVQPTPVVPPWDGKELKILEAGITSLSSKMDKMSQKMSKMASGEDVTNSLGVLGNQLSQARSQTIEQVKTSAGATKAQVDKVDHTVSQLSTKLDSGVSSLHQGLKQVQDSLAKRPAAPLVQNPRPEPKPDVRAGELETQVKQLHQVLDLTRAELLQADIAFKIALEGDLYEEADPTATSTDSGSGMDALQIARGIRTRTLRLIARCRSLFSLVVGGSADANLAIMEGEWGRCVDHLQARDRVVRKAIAEKNEAFRELQCFRFLVDQIRRGFYNRSEWKLALNAAGQNFADLMEPTNDGFSGILLLAQEMYRLQHSPSRPRKASSSYSNSKYGESRSMRPPGWALLSNST